MSFTREELERFIISLYEKKLPGKAAKMKEGITAHMNEVDASTVHNITLHLHKVGTMLNKQNKSLGAFDGLHEAHLATEGATDATALAAMVVALHLTFEPFPGKLKDVPGVTHIEAYLECLVSEPEAIDASSAAQSDNKTIVPLENASNATVVPDSAGLPELLKKLVDTLIKEVRPFTCYKVAEILKIRCGEPATIENVFFEIKQLYKGEKAGSPPVGYLNRVKNLLNSGSSGFVVKGVFQWKKLFAEAAKEDGLCVASKDNKGSVPVSPTPTDAALIQATRAAALEVMILYIQEVGTGEININELLKHLVKLITAFESHIFRGLVMLLEVRTRLTPKKNFTQLKLVAAANFVCLFAKPAANFVSLFAKPSPAGPENEAEAEAEANVILGIEKQDDSAGKAVKMSETEFEENVRKLHSTPLLQVLITHLILTNWPKDEFVKAMQRIVDTYAETNTISMDVLKDILPDFEGIARDIPEFVDAVQKSAPASAPAPAMLSMTNVKNAANPFNFSKNFAAGFNHVKNVLVSENESLDEAKGADTAFDWDNDGEYNGSTTQ